MLTTSWCSFEWKLRTNDKYDRSRAKTPSYSKSPSSNFVNITSLTVDSAKKLITNARTQQSVLDPWPTWLTKNCSNVISPHIVRLVNISFFGGCVVSTLKKPSSLPSQKLHLEMTDINNYRPISNPSVVSKIQDTTACSRLVTYLDDNNLIPP